MEKSKKIGLPLVIVLMSYFLILMDNSIIFTSTLKIASNLRMNEIQLSWVSNAYTVTFGGFLLLAGRLGDLLGRKIIFMIGLAIFATASLSIALTQSGTQMIVWRAIQGLGSAIIAPTSLALLMDYYSGQLRTKAIASYGVTAGIGASVGLLLGGWLTSAVTWRAGFLINVPLSLILILMTWKVIEKGKKRKQRIDWGGSLASVLIALLFVYGITIGGWLLIILSLVACFGFYWYEQRLSYALIPMEIFKNKVRTGAYLARFLFMMAMLTYWFILPQIMQNFYHFSPLEAGMGFLPLTLVGFFSALVLPQLTEKWGNQFLLIVGQSILLMGMLLTALMNPAHGYWLAIGLPMFIVGLGQGWLLAPLTAAGVEDVAPELSGAASGLTNMMHQLGGPVGLSLVVFATAKIKNTLLYYHVVMGFVVLFLTLGLIVLYVTNYAFGAYHPSN